MGDIREEVQSALGKLGSSPQMDNVRAFIGRLMKNAATTGLPPLEAMGLKPAVIEGYYKKAFQLYKSGKYNEAKKLLRVMVMLCPTEHKFCFALAACYHRNGDLGQALAGYQSTSISDPTDPLPYYHAADCLTKMGLSAAAAESLKIAIHNCGSNPTFAVIKDRATMALKKMQAGEGSGEGENQPKKK